ncbi:MAG: amidohydrolase family protein [Ruminococcaceae bacterium]|nr:amidohydrolase family protein [Oscillospiraceae bacterium]
MSVFDFPVIDSHVHISGPKCLDFMKTYCSHHGFQAVNIACLAHDKANDPLQNILAALLKLQDKRFYAHGSLAYPTLPLDRSRTDADEFARQARLLHDIGFDGIKMLEGKPTTRKKTGLPQNDPLYDPYYAEMAKTGRHIVWHVADPETFWDKDKAPAFSFSSGWFYGDGTFQTKQQLYDEVLDVLRRHPGLNVTFAHFFFLGDFPDQAEDMLRQFPNVSLDITPGREMYEQFSQRPARWQSFFHQYADRILFGTDMTSTEFQGAAGDLIDSMKRFLATQDTFTYWDFTIQGLGLSAADCTRICQTNFTTRAGHKPRPIDREALKAYISQHRQDIDDAKALRYIDQQMAL